MITAELRRQVDRTWTSFSTGGSTSPLEVLEPLTYLLFLRRLDDLQTLAEAAAARRPQQVVGRLAELEQELQQGLKDLTELLP